MNIGYINLFLETASDGSVDAVFPGGIQISNGVTSTPPDSRRVRWVDDDGVQRAEIYAYDNGGAGDENAFFLAEPLAGRSGFMTVGAAGPAADGANVNAQYSPNASGQFTFVNASAINGALSKTARIVTANGASSFLQLPSAIRSALGNGANGVAVNVAAGTSAALGPFTAGFPLSGAGSFAFLAVLGGINGSAGPEFFSWTWASVNATQYQVVVHNNHPTSTITAGWSGVPVGLG